MENQPHFIKPPSVKDNFCKSNGAIYELFLSQTVFLWVSCVLYVAVTLRSTTLSKPSWEGDCLSSVISPQKQTAEPQRLRNPTPVPDSRIAWHRTGEWSRAQRPHLAFHHSVFDSAWCQTAREPRQTFAIVMLTTVVPASSNDKRCSTAKHTLKPPLFLQKALGLYGVLSCCSNCDLLDKAENLRS